MVGSIYRMGFASISLRLQELMIEEMFNHFIFYDLTWLFEAKKKKLYVAFVLRSLIAVDLCM